MEKSLEKINTELEIEEHLDVHRKGFAVQRVGLLFLLAIVVAGALGVFGDGLLSNESVSLSTGVVTFQKFHRHEAIMKLGVSISTNERREVIVSFPSSYLKSLEIKTITPAVSRVALHGNTIDYIFAGNGSNSTINFSIVPHSLGMIQGQIEVNNSPVDIAHFIYP